MKNTAWFVLCFLLSSVASEADPVGPIRLEGTIGPEVGILVEAYYRQHVPLVLRPFKDERDGIWLTATPEVRVTEGRYTVEVERTATSPEGKALYLRHVRVTTTLEKIPEVLKSPALEPVHLDVYWPSSNGETQPVSGIAVITPMPDRHDFVTGITYPWGFEPKTVPGGREPYFDFSRKDYTNPMFKVRSVWADGSIEYYSGMDYFADPQKDRYEVNFSFMFKPVPGVHEPATP